MNSNSKGFAQFIIILAGTLVVILAIGFFAFKNGQLNFTSTTGTNKITEWKSYTNEAYGWSIEYPPEWYLHNKGFINRGKTGKQNWINPDAIVYISQDAIPDNLDENSEYELNDKVLKIHYETNNESIVNLLAEYQKRPDYYSSSELSINGNKSYKIILKPESGDDSEFEKVTWIYLIDYPRSAYKILIVIFPDDEIYHSIFKKFKLLNNEYNSSSWNEYINNEFSFSVKYPLGWYLTEDDVDSYINSERTLIDILKPAIGSIQINIKSFEKTGFSKTPGIISESATLSGQPATLYKIPFIEGVVLHHYEVINNGVTYTIQLTPIKNNYIEYLDQILSTFKFLE